MKILFVSAAGNIHTVRWVNAMAEKGHEVHLAYNKGHEPSVHKIDDRVKLHQLRFGGVAGYYLNGRELKKIEAKINPAVINVHYASGYGTLARISKIGDYILSIWGSDVYDFPYKNIINKYILKKNVKKAKVIASTSECMAEQLKKVTSNGKLKIYITPFGVDLKRFEIEKNRVKDKKNILIGTVKTLEPVYRINDLIDAISVLLENLQIKGEVEIAKKIRVHIYGDGNQKEELLAQIKNLNLQEVICLKGKIPNTDVPKVLQEFDVFCATSEKESFGVAVVEAMAMEKAVVVTNAEGFKEVVDNSTGYIVDVKNVEQIASALEVLILDEGRRIEMGVEARKRVERLYDWEKNVDVMEKLYFEVSNELKKEF